MTGAVAAAEASFNAGMTSLSKVFKGLGIEANEITRLYTDSQNENKIESSVKKEHTGNKSKRITVNQLTSTSEFTTSSFLNDLSEETVTGTV